MLSQKHKAIAYASSIFNSKESNYPVTERECLVVVWMLEKFRSYFSEKSITLITDHSAHVHLTTGKHLSSRTIRWDLKIVEFNVKIEHRAEIQYCC